MAPIVRRCKIIDSPFATKGRPALFEAASSLLRLSAYRCRPVIRYSEVTFCSMQSHTHRLVCYMIVEPFLAPMRSARLPLRVHGSQPARDVSDSDVLHLGILNILCQQDIALVPCERQNPAVVTSAQRLLLTEKWTARRNNTQWIPTFRS